MFLFHNEFFPTPSWLIKKMLLPYLTGDRIKDLRNGMRRIEAVFDPSAGDGRILEWVKRRYQYRTSWGHRDDYKNCNGPKLYAVEIDPNLVSILQSKKIRVLSRDFLEFVPENKFDLIAMNPPFSEGAKHLLHAWDILPHGDIVCLLNAETVRNPYCREREILGELIAQYGSVEYIGAAFSEADKQTDCEIALVRLCKPEETTENVNFKGENLSKDETPNLGIDQGEGMALMQADRMEAYIRTYSKSKEAYINFLKAQQEVRFYAGTIVGDYELGKLLESEHSMEHFSDVVRKSFWIHLLKMTGIEKYLTTGVKKKFSEFVDSEGAMSLTKGNIYSVMEMIVLSRTSIMEQAISEVFDSFTHYYKENRSVLEGWKSNSAWKANRKLVLPHWVNYSFNRFSLANSWTKYEDIDKVMAYLNRDRLEDIVTISSALHASFNSSGNGVAESTYFKIRYYQKGTVHITFKDEELLNRFNIAACKYRNWVGKEPDKEAETDQEKNEAA